MKPARHDPSSASCSFARTSVGCVLALGIAGFGTQAQTPAFGALASGDVAISSLSAAPAYSSSTTRPDVNRLFDASVQQGLELVPEVVLPRAFPASNGSSNPLNVVIGEHDLQPNQNNQLVILHIQNVSASPVEVGGLNLFLQVADGGPGYGVILGPEIESGELGVGTLFDGNNRGTSTYVADRQLGNWSVTYDSGPVTLAANEAKPIGYFYFSTLGVAEGSYDLLLRWTVPGLESFTAFDDVDGNTLDILDIADGHLNVVPEPWAVSAVSALGLFGFAGFRRFLRLRSPVQR